MSARSSFIWRDSYLSWPAEPRTAHSEVIQSTRDGITELLRNGAQSVHIAFAAEDTKQNHTNFRTLCSNEGLEYEELKAVCFAEEYKWTKKFLAPLVGSVHYPFANEYIANDLENFIENMLIANRVQAHIVDQSKFGPAGALRNIVQMREKVSDDTAGRTLDRLEGFIREYAGLSVLRMKGTSPLGYEELRTIMSTSDYQNLAQQYRELGRSDNMQTVIKRINDHLIHLASSEGFQHGLKLANIGVSIVASAFSPIVSLLELIFDAVKAKKEVEFIPMFIPSSAIGWQQYNGVNP